MLWTYLRSLPAVSFCTPSADLLSARRLAVAVYAANQEKFHTGFAEQHFAAKSGWSRYPAALSSLRFTWLRLNS